jgi:TonB family protein
MGPINEIVVVEQAPDAQKEVKPVEMPNAMKVKKAEKEAFDVVEQMPQFPGGPEALMQFLSQNVKYPKEAYEKNVQGRVIASFVVEKDGSITEAVIRKSIDPLLDAEALRVIGSMPNWMPGMQNGEAVRVKYTVPITFRLQGSSTEKAAEKYILEIDGKVADDSEIGSIPPGDIKSMHIEKGENGQPKKIIITTKKKK